MKRFNLIAAVGVRYELGQNGQLLGDFSTDLRRFREKTLGQIVIMGYSTFVSIGRALPGRTNIVMTRDKSKLDDVADVVAAGSLGEACCLALGLATNDQEVFVIGGAEIYRQFLEADLVDTVYLTVLQRTFYNADTFFPFGFIRNWRVVSSEEVFADGVCMKFQILKPPSAVAQAA